ncbi:MAG: alpha/beta hydrolase [Devosiaceae bacterium]
MVKPILIVLFLASAAYLAALAALYGLQRPMLYVAGGELRSPVEIGLAGVGAFQLETPDGERLAAWYHPPEQGEHTILYLQGNAQTLSDRVDAFGQMMAAGYGLLAISYRGFEGSTGMATQDGLITDALAAYDWLAARGDQVVAYGQSLGTGVAVQLAAQRNVEAVVLEVPFTAAVDVAAAQYPMFPVRLLMTDQWRSRDVIADINAPVLIVGAGQDQVVPVEQSRALFELAQEPKQYVLLEQSTHIGPWDHGMGMGMTDFLDAHLAPVER